MDTNTLIALGLGLVFWTLWSRVSSSESSVWWVIGAFCFATGLSAVVWSEEVRMTFGAGSPYLAAGFCFGIGVLSCLSSVCSTVISGNKGRTVLRGMMLASTAVVICILYFFPGFRVEEGLLAILDGQVLAVGERYNLQPAYEIRTVVIKNPLTIEAEERVNLPGNFNGYVKVQAQMRLLATAGDTIYKGFDKGIFLENLRSYLRRKALLDVRAAKSEAELPIDGYKTIGTQEPVTSQDVVVLWDGRYTLTKRGFR